MHYATWRSRTGTLVFAFALACGCKHVLTDGEAIRVGITQHLASLKTLNLGAMDLDLNSISIQGTQAHVQVTFRPKTGAPPGAGMQVAYLLEKRDSQWIVVRTEGVGGGIEHPAANTNPHLQPSQAGLHGSMPNFRELIPSNTSATSGTLPPGHPSINSTAQPKSTASDGKPD